MSLALFNDSSITLVNPDPPASATLTFSHASVTHAVISLLGNPIYQISPANPTSGTTNITDLVTGQVIVTIQRPIQRPDTIKFALRYDGQALLLNDWLEETKTSDGRPIWTVRTPRGSFVWRTHATLRLVLAPKYNLSRSIAWVNLPEQEDVKIALVLAPGTESFRDEIVAAFCVLEQRLRVNDKALQRGRKAGVKNPLFQFTTGMVSWLDEW